jgi:NAD(P)-dependent dehydrogenase (short-subunit alcohol dehydrogenase family)
MDLSLGLEGTHVLITGGAGYIGRTVVDAFLSAGAKVTSLDIAKFQHPPSLSTSENFLELNADTTSQSSLETAWLHANTKFGPVETCVALAAMDMSVLPHHESAIDLPIEQFRRTLEVNVLGTFAVAQQWLRGLRLNRANPTAKKLRNLSLVLIGSESGHFGERMNADYSTSKSAVQFGLLRSLRQDTPRVFEGARVNAVAPGAVNTPRFPQECALNPNQYYDDCVATTPLAKPVEMEQVAKTLLFLASDNFSGSIHGQIVNVDGGKGGKVVWHKDESGETIDTAKAHFT